MKTAHKKFEIAVLQTKRLFARQLTAEDFPLLFKMNQNAYTMANLGGIRTVEATRKNLAWNLAQWQENGFGLWLWFEKQTKQLVGRGGLRKITIESQLEIEISYALFPEFWGQGFATEIAQACMEIGFMQLKLPKLVCHTTITNKASQRVMEKVGLHFVRYFTQHDEPHILYKLEANDYYQHMISFKPLAVTDLELLVNWLNKPHVKAWWDDNLTAEQIREKYRGRMGDQTTYGFIIYFNEKPLGFIQYYYANRVGEGWWPEEVEGTVGIDQYIGEEAYINRGYGSLIIKTFVTKLLDHPRIKKIIVDVDPNNLRAIRCYEKVGFKLIKPIQTPDGLALLMEFMQKNQ